MKEITYENRLSVARGDRKALRRFRAGFIDFAAKYQLHLSKTLAIIRIDGKYQVVPIRRDKRKVYDYGEIVLIAAYNVNPGFDVPHDAWEHFIQQQQQDS